MPTITKLDFPKLDNVDIINAIRGVSSNEFQDRIPEATKANIQTSMDLLYKNGGLRNQAANGLVNQIGLIIIRDVLYWENKLAKFKQGMLNSGESIEEIQIGLVKAKAFDSTRSSLEDAVFGRERVETQATVHHINRRDKYKITIDDVEFKKAFLTEFGLHEFITKLMSRMEVSDQYDEFLIMTQLFREYYQRGGFHKVHVPAVDAPDSGQAESREFLRTLKAVASNMAFPTRRYNAAKMEIATTEDELEIFITPEALAAIQVEGLAAAFNIDQTDIMGRITVIPKAQMKIPGAQAVLTTRNFWVCADTVFETRSIQNPDGLYDNYWLHRHGIYSTSLFAPAVLLWDGESDEWAEDVTPVTSLSDIVVLDGETELPVTTVEHGKFYQVNVQAITTPADGANNDVQLTLAGPLQPGSFLTQTGTLFINVMETAAAITITARATDDLAIVKTRGLNITGTGGVVFPKTEPEYTPVP